jgi:hypothetical protein
MREQRFEPPLHGLPSWMQPPPPVMKRQRPAVPSFFEHALPQHSASE